MRFKTIVKEIANSFVFHKKQKSDIYIVTLARSGSTILAEILMNQPKLKFVSEPLNYFDERTKLKFKKYNKDFKPQDRYVDLNSENLDSLFKYLKKLSFNNYHVFHVLGSKINYPRFNTNRSLFKIHRITYYLNELIEQNTEINCVYLLRHPVSHSLSRLKNNWDDYIIQYLKSKKVVEILNQNQIQFLNRKLKTASTLEKLVMSWVLENLVFINDYQKSILKKQIIPVFYEDLILNSEKTIKEICESVEIQFQEKMLDKLNTPSKGIVHSQKEVKEQILKGERIRLINRWKQEVTEKEKMKIQEILDVCNVNIYNTKSALPIV